MLAHPELQDRQATLVQLDLLDQLAHPDLLVNQVQLGPRVQTVMLELLEALDQLGNRVSEETMEYPERQALLDFEVTLVYRDQMDSLDLLVLLDHQVQEERQVVPDLLVQWEMLELLDLREHLEEMVRKELLEPQGPVDNRATLDSRDPEVKLVQPGHRVPVEVLELRDLKVTWAQLVQPAPQGQLVDRDLEEI